MSAAHEPSPAMEALARAVSDARASALPGPVAQWAHGAYARGLARCAALGAPADAYHHALAAGRASGDPVFGATVAMARRAGASDGTRLRAYAIGAEVRARVAAALRGASSAAAWDERGSAGVLGAAIAAGTLLALERDGVMRAFGIAASETAGFGSVRPSEGAPLIAGKAAANGLIAALLAGDGFTACAGLDPGRGFFALVAYPQGQDARWRADACAAVAAGFGTRWAVLEGSVA